jgi:dienelactone hydrolase
MPRQATEPRIDIGAHFGHLRDGLPHRMSFRPGTIEFAAWRKRTRAMLREHLGLPRVANRLLGAREEALDEVEIRGQRFRMQRVLLQTEPDLLVPAFFCLPLKSEGRLPVVICCQGHSTAGMRLSVGLVDDKTWEGAVVNGDRDFALQAVRHGYAALALEMRGFGELRLAPDIEKNANNSCARLVLLALQGGRTLVGMRVHDIMAAIEYLSQRPDIDRKHIVLTGNSGGGTVTLYTAALEDRLAASVPSCAFCTYADSIEAVDHCACNFVPGLSQEIEMGDLAGLAAPKPQLIIAGKTDTIFPERGVREAFAQAKAIYKAAGAADQLRLYIGEGGHRYYAEPVWPWLEGLR